MRSLRREISRLSLRGNLIYPSLQHRGLVDVADEFKIRGNIWRKVKVDVCDSIIRWMTDIQEKE